MLKYGCSKNGREKKYIERTKKHTNIFFFVKVSKFWGEWETNFEILFLYYSLKNQYHIDFYKKKLKVIDILNTP